MHIRIHIRQQKQQQPEQSDYLMAACVLEVTNHAAGILVSATACGIHYCGG